MLHDRTRMSREAKGRVEGEKQVEESKMTETREHLAGWQGE
jgi:hypothetical protein